MRTSISTKFQLLASMIAKYRVMKLLLHPFKVFYNSIVARNRNILMKKNGVKVLEDFDRVIRGIDVRYSIFAGTLLGGIREGGFLKNDIDIDTVIFYKDYSPAIRTELEKDGFKFVHCYLVENGLKGREDTFQKNGVYIDIFYIYSDSRFPTYQCDFHSPDIRLINRNNQRNTVKVAVRRIEFLVSYEVVRIPFETIEVNAISNAKQWLEKRYGKDYMIPNPDFKDKGDNPGIFEWKDVNAVMYY